MKKLRLFVVVSLCGFAPMLWGWAVDGEPPDYSATGWAVLVGGIVLIAGGSLVIESIVERRRVRAPGTASAGDRPAPPAGR